MPAQRRDLERRRYRWVGLIIIALSVIVLVWRCSLADERAADRLARGHAAIVRALAGDAAAFDEAEQVLAAAASVTDAYPLFALEATRRLRDARQRSPLGPELVSSTTQSGEGSRAGPSGATYTAPFDDAEPSVRAVFDALSSNDFAKADAAVAALPPTLPGRAHLARFVAELRRQPRRPASSSPLGR